MPDHRRQQRGALWLRGALQVRRLRPQPRTAGAASRFGGTLSTFTRPRWKEEISSTRSRAFAMPVPLPKPRPMKDQNTTGPARTAMPNGSELAQLTVQTGYAVPVLHAAGQRLKAAFPAQPSAISLCWIVLIKYSLPAP